MKRLTRRETDIMHVLWNATEALSARDIAQANPEISQNTIQSLIKKLLDENFIKVDGFKSTGTIYTRKFVPNISEQEYFFTTVSKKSFQKYLTAFITDNNNARELQDLKTKVNKRLKELQ
ncbi:hypothetical protein JG30_00580 [Bombilactobacillus mellifer]|uniref:Penicillinase repressor n=1 Tax=Bombilactobacillus mellifer TaxID=1218492 RepID=A0A0F4LYF0_9LACO|nr:BlaI/MecI/CopY family transcriptional regulator [Bombilactobacillus mellifer]MBH9991305.1 BlaI/MecI/CopY family transcriptional regulator [Lactobacillus sp. W8092]KJY63378.1 hypothetical protein JG30_00580 [Bombilactobacillus mellifer]MCT6826360.1 BlaI/MecI/CopY family transcriptional regulator [Bombilactobacillus mellifer]MCT6844273.1 BlaI/MecI/CopY family transcriptional regulator [Bombilactobacillus mellifer]MCT6894834.1 BlaI/MecI/CopY family transcriptional regulator [Bombilactobacillus